MGTRLWAMEVVGGKEDEADYKLSDALDREAKAHAPKDVRSGVIP